MEKVEKMEKQGRSNNQDDSSSKNELQLIFNCDIMHALINCITILEANK